MFISFSSGHRAIAGRFAVIAFGAAVFLTGVANPHAQQRATPAASEAPKPTPAEDLKRLVGEIQKTLENVTVNTPEVSQSLTTLLESIDKAQAKELKNIKALADRIAAILGKTKPGDPGLTETLQVLRDAVEAAEAISTADGIAKRSDRLAKALSDQANADAVKAAATAKALGDLSATIETVRQKYAVYVLSATYGDRRFPFSRSRQCDVTSTVRKQCLAEGASCTPKSIVSANVLARCDYDPVPFAPDKYRAITVRFACVAASEGAVQKLLDAPPSDLPNSRWSTLQGDAVLQCDVETKAAEKKEDPKKAETKEDPKKATPAEAGKEKEQEPAKTDAQPPATPPAANTQKK